jgi:hypothetical protein
MQSPKALAQSQTFSDQSTNKVAVKISSYPGTYSNTEASIYTYETSVTETHHLRLPAAETVLTS